MMADEQREVGAMSEGNIAVAVGMKTVSLPGWAAWLDLVYWFINCRLVVYWLVVC